MADISSSFEKQTDVCYESGTFTYIEIFDHPQDRVRTSQTGFLRHEQVQDWLKQNSTSANAWKTRILLSPKTNSRTEAELSCGNSFLPSRIPHLNAIIDVFNIPNCYSRILHGGLTASMRFPPELGSDGFIMQCCGCRAVDWHFSIAATINRPGVANQIFVHGLQVHEIHSLAEALSGSEYREMWPPVALLLYLIDKRAAIRISELRSCVLLLKEIQAYLTIDVAAEPMGRPASITTADLTARKGLFSLDLVTTTSHITKVSSKLAVYKDKSLVEISMLAVLQSICTVGVGIVEHGTCLTGAPLYAMEKMKIMELESYFRSFNVEANRYGPSADAQRQTVYALIAQKDSLLNIQATQAFLRVAESSQADNIAMKLIAEATAQDSASISVITAITAVFLPATFTATLFSTTFFDFQSSLQGHVVSPWIWLYWCITSILTVLILVIWNLWFKKKKRKMQNLLQCVGTSDIKPAISSNTALNKSSKFLERTVTSDLDDDGYSLRCLSTEA
jgi:hypothetical protein